MLYSVVSISSLDFQSVMAVCCLVYLSDPLVSSQGMPADVGSWDTGISGGRKVERKWFVGSTGDVSKGKGGSCI